MINELEKSKIISVLDKHYSNKVLAYLLLNDIKPVRAERYTNTAIREIVCGVKSNAIVEAAIWELVEETFAKNKKIADKKAALIASLQY